MIDKAFIQKKFDTMFSDDLNKLAYSWDITLITPDNSNVMKSYSIKALVEMFDDEYLKNQTTYNEDSRVVKIFIEDLDALRTLGNKISKGSLKDNKSTFVIDGKKYSINAESLQGARRIFVFKCLRIN